MIKFEMYKDILLFNKPSFFRRPNLNQFFFSTIPTHVELNQIILEFFINQLESGKGKLCS